MSVHVRIVTGSTSYGGKGATVMELLLVAGTVAWIAVSLVVIVSLCVAAAHGDQDLALLVPDADDRATADAMAAPPTVPA